MEYKLKTFLLFFVFGFLFAELGSANNDSDRILHFHARISIDSSGLCTVTETIKIYNGRGGDNSTNDAIQRGIVRELPTIYVTKSGWVHTVPFKLVSVKMDGGYESHFYEKENNGIRIYIGQSDIKLPEGVHEYEITYTTARQIIFNEDKDEFYWNVNGNGWSFDIEKISCLVTFPAGSEIIENACYTGVQGSTDNNCQFSITDDNSIAFEATTAFTAYEGLTIASSIKKGILTQPTLIENIVFFVQDNMALPVALLGVFVVFLFNFVAWYRYGRDPARGLIYPQFEPPKGMSPADVGFVVAQKYKPEHFTAAIIDHAVKKRLKIDVKKEGWPIKKNVYHFLPPDNGLEFERDYGLYNTYGFDIVDLYNQEAANGTYNSKLAGIHRTLGQTLSDRFEVEKGKKNSFLAAFSLNNSLVGLGIFFLVMLCMASIILIVIKPSLLLGLVVGGVLITGFVIQWLFARILPAYTPQGRDITDHILGFKRYLSTTEQSVFDTLNPPEMTLQLFEKYLPYAIALQCENRWAKKFESIISNAIQNGYSPSYYNVSNSTFSTRHFSHSLSSGLTGSISSATTPPSSSSGGGSSGGGGGGGGGGGW
jgi:uncharacterized membrane protein YgcG